MSIENTLETIQQNSARLGHISGFLAIKVHRPSLTNRLAKLGENDGDGNKCQRQKAEQRVPPSEAKSRKHRWTSQREQCTDKRSRRRQGCIGGCRIFRVAVDDIRLNGHVDTHHAKAKGEHANDWYDPKDVLFGRPAIPEEADWQDASKEDHHRKSHLTLELSAIASSQLHYHSIAGRRDDQKAD